MEIAALPFLKVDGRNVFAETI